MLRREAFARTRVESMATCPNFPNPARRAICTTCVNTLLMARRCRRKNSLSVRPEKVTGDSGFFSGQALHQMKQRGIDLYVPDNNLRHEMRTGERAEGMGACRIRDPEHLRMREKLRSVAGRAWYRRRQAVVEPVFGILKEQRGMRRFRRRGLEAVTTEWMLAAIAYNLTRMARS